MRRLRGVIAGIGFTSMCIAPGAESLTVLGVMAVVGLVALIWGLYPWMDFPKGGRRRERINGYTACTFIDR